MSIDRLFDHTADWYRQVPPDDPRSRGEYGEVLEVFEPVVLETAQTYNCRPDQAWSGVLQDSGPGEQQAGRQRWFLHRGFAGIQERDILDIVSGNLAGVRLKVQSVTPQNTRFPVIHHVEVNVEVWHGVLELAGEEYP